MPIASSPTDGQETGITEVWPHRLVLSLSWSLQSDRGLSGTSRPASLDQSLQAGRGPAHLWDSCL